MDCSIEKSTPPEVFLLPYEGLCDTSSSGSCQQIHIIGFFHSEVVFVKLTCFVVNILKKVKKFINLGHFISSSC